MEMPNIAIEHKSTMSKLKSLLMQHIVTVIFIVISLLGIIVAKQPVFFILNELIQRISRNSFLVLSLLIPVMAGMGLNFSIIVGAMAGQMAIIMVTNWGIGGTSGLLFSMLLAIPFAIIIGNLTGRLLNKTKGQEMIASMIVGYFANGIYQFIFLFLVGTLIPLRNKTMLLRSGVGLRNTIDLADGIKYSLDGIFNDLLRLPFFGILIFIATCLIIYNLLRMFVIKHVNLKESRSKRITGIVISLLVLVFSINVMYNNSLSISIKMLKNLKVPVATLFIVGLLCIFNIIITKTKLGQDLKTVGQDQHVAKVSGINVNKVRVIAITISTLLAAWGQIIFLQNIGVLNTFGSHMQIGLFSVAALLVGGASVNKATIGQALLGVTLFHTLFVISPYAGKELFGDPQIGEYFRAFVAYGAIGLSLGLYAWRKTFSTKK